MPLPLPPRTQSPPLPTKRPRGLWRARCRDTDSTKSGTRSHDALSDVSSDFASSSSRSSVETAFDDDDDDVRSSSSSSKRRRLSGALSDSETLCQLSPSSRALTPDLCYHASLFPTQSLSCLSSHPFCSVFPRMQDKDNKYASINSKAKGKQPSGSDLEDWVNLKELFARASESYEGTLSLDCSPLCCASVLSLQSYHCSGTVFGKICLRCSCRSAGGATWGVRSASCRVSSLSVRSSAFSSQQLRHLREVNGLEALRSADGVCSLPQRAVGGSRARGVPNIRRQADCVIPR
ncbi:uncharacterized protein PHACADRAFT_104579 [Phanerochaete carnosa HHB-10118-sp]|uniref:Uncharacterized protein n=1 Tax=Phanerochaete carnosa (strain HHB-10118-sp) TaxID=650164 RepID=K5UM43_PHACS|nr:uncharacterized protein PHACADRAFT_104579 [Phanerochaete carnosa HHB-10118-sp]EKM50776.1 hypothetical protein PHACADRAFT_104579 [Phanerochaete carnosa HHB-10118-sp]